MTQLMPESTFRLTVEYDGTNMAGFQAQSGVRTVQGELEAAILKIIGVPVRVTGAGRTDTGVHALGQVVSFRCWSRVPVERMPAALNGALPQDVSIREARVEADSFNARFSATARRYCYLTLNSSHRSALHGRFTGQCAKPLNVAAMREAAEWLKGEQDFSSFATQLVPGEPTCRFVRRVQVHRRGNLVVLHIEANAFLRGMVRAITGTLWEVGSGKRLPSSMPELLANRDRRLAGAAAPAKGLCLVGVRYGDVAAQSWNKRNINNG